MTSHSSEQLARRAQNGDVSAMETLVHRHAHVARIIAARYYLAGGDREDLRQEALVGLWKAIRDYRDGLGSTFDSFGELCIERQVITAIKTANRLKHQPLNEAYLFSMAVHGVDGDQMELGDAFDDNGRGDPYVVIAERDAFRALVTFFAENLSDLELEVLRGRADGESYEETEARLLAGPDGQRTGRAKATPVKSVDNAVQRIRRKAEVFLDAERDAA